MGDIGTADNQGIQAILFDFFKRFVIFINMRLCFRTSFQTRYGKRMDMELNDLITGAHQSKKLSFCRLQCGIGHHIEQADMHFPAILMTGAIRR